MGKKKAAEHNLAAEPVAEQPSTVNRFDFEQKFLNTWHITDDVRLLYDIRFDDTFTYFEQMIRERKIQ
jgi:hypothetical protein